MNDQGSPVSAEAPPARTCLNCGAALTGPWCASCGQRDERHVHSLWHFMREATESLTHADSRLWRTIWALLFRPGFLTREFFDGRRARYLPPFRLYLVISIGFFLLLAALPREDARVVSLNIGSGSPAAAAGQAAAPAAADDPCDIEYEGPGRGWVRPGLRHACEISRRDGGAALQGAFVQNLPRAMFVLLPLLAGTMMLLYWRPRRFYVEHLLLFVHNHSFVFLATGLAVLLSLALPASVSNSWLVLPLIAWFAWYFFRAMRVFYGQSRGRTLAKFWAIGFSYLGFAVLTLVFTVLVSALTL